MSVAFIFWFIELDEPLIKNSSYFFQFEGINIYLICFPNELIALLQFILCSLLLLNFCLNSFLEAIVIGLIQTSKEFIVCKKF